MKDLIVLVATIAVLVFLYRSCTRGYDQYAYFVQVKDEVVFTSYISDTDARVIDHGRKLKIDISQMDQEVDNGDGPDQGALRWYDCNGIDCDEGWQQSFIPQK